MRERLKEEREVLFRILSGKEFQIKGEQYENDRVPNVLLLPFGLTRKFWSDDRSWRDGQYGVINSLRYDGH